MIWPNAFFARGLAYRSDLLAARVLFVSIT